MKEGLRRGRHLGRRVLQCGGSTAADGAGALALVGHTKATHGLLTGFAGQHLLFITINVLNHIIYH